jgi:hypothetical protein
MRNAKLVKAMIFMAFGTLISLLSLTQKQDVEVRLTAISSMERISQSEPLFGKPNAVIKAARNEYESFQVVVGAVQKNIRVISAEMSELTGQSGIIGKENISLYRPEFVRIRRSSDRAQLPPGLYAEPLVPFINPLTGEATKPGRRDGHDYYAVPFDVWKGQNQPIWVDVYVPKNAAAGDYEGTFTVTLGNFPRQWGSSPDVVTTKVISIPINLTVWDFALPDGPTHRNYFGRDLHVRKFLEDFDLEADSEEYREMALRYCRIFSEHRLNPPLPNFLLPEMNSDGSLHIDPKRHNELKSFIEGLHVTDFAMPRAPIHGFSQPKHQAYTELTPADRARAVRYYRDYYSYLKDNGWHKRAYLYMYDEPNTSEHYARVLELGDVVREGAPELRILVIEQPYAEDPSWPDINPSVDIWCPHFSMIDRGSINYVLAQGDEVWSYTALSQRAPEYHPKYDEVKDYDSPYWNLDALLASQRTPTWMNYQYGITGILGWTLNSNVEHPWYLPGYGISSRHYNGAGYLVYPGLPCGIDGPISSIRLKNLRESMEDYEYLHLYEKLAGREAVLKLVERVAPNWWTTTGDPDVIFSTREKIAEEIIKLIKNSANEPSRSRTGKVLKR